MVKNFITWRVIDKDGFLKTLLEMSFAVVLNPKFKEFYDEYEHGEEGFDKTIIETYGFLAHEGKIEMLKQFKDLIGVKSDEWIIEACVWNGQLETLKWLLDNGFEYYNKDNEICCNIAISFGYSDMLKYLCERNFSCTKGIVELAADGGHLECLTWLIENGYKYDKEHCIKTAKFHGHEDVIKYLESLCPEAKKEVKITSRRTQFRKRVKKLVSVLEKFDSD